MSANSAEKILQSKQFGSAAEQFAALYYKNNGYSILACNFTVRGGEIDVIAQKDNTVVFVEVKARGDNSIAKPCEFVTPSKIKKIICAARVYLSLNFNTEPFVRFDVAEVTRRDGELIINCIENAFNANGK